MQIRLAVLPELRNRLRARAWAGGRVETLVFRSAPEAEVFVVGGRLLPRTDGQEGALGVLWLRLDGLSTPDERLAVNDFTRAQCEPTYRSAPDVRGRGALADARPSAAAWRSGE